MNAAGCYLGKKMKKSRTKAVSTTLTPGASISLAAFCIATVLTERHRNPVVEFKKKEDYNPNSLGDRFQDSFGYYSENGQRRKGYAHAIVANSEFGGRAASDVYDYLSRRRAAESAKVGQFKITENSPNTARITVGPDVRERRKKYVWERVGVQRNLAIAGLAAATAATGLITHRVKEAGGIKNVLGRAANAVKKGAARLVGGEEAASAIKPFVAEKTAAQKLAEVDAQAVARKAAQKISAAKGVATRDANYTRDFPHGHKWEPLYPEEHPEAFHPSGRRKMKRVAMTEEEARKQIPFVKKTA
jgi:hypothetical protein